MSHIPLLTQFSALKSILDLACGTGQNGLYLLPLHFRDKNSTQLSALQNAELSTKNILTTLGETALYHPAT